MCFTGNPGTGKTTVAMRMADILHRLGYIERNHVVAVTRDDLVGQYVGHTAPKTKEVLKRAYGGVLFIDEAYYLYRPENERDYGVEAIEILLAGDGERARAPGRGPGRLQGPDGRLLPAQPRDVLARRAPHRLPRLHGRRAARDRAADARRASPTSSPPTPRTRSAHYLELRMQPAAVRPRSQRPQRASSGRGCARRTASTTAVRAGRAPTRSTAGQDRGRRTSSRAACSTAERSGS